jgi:hypothetical protein
MNVSSLPEVLLRVAPAAQTDLPLEADGVQRFVWESRWGAMLIEVVDERMFVNGMLVEPTTQP